MDTKTIFPGQLPDEKIFLFVRRHWLNLFPIMMTTLIMALVPFIAAIVIKSAAPNFLTDYRQYFLLASSAYLLFVSALFMIGWLDYYYDVLIITNERLVHVEQIGLFNRQFSELNLIRTQNVSTCIKGILPTVFDFGNLVVETAGHMGNTEEERERTGDFTMESIPHPNKLASTIMELHDRLVHGSQQNGSNFSGEGEVRPPQPFSDPNPPRQGDTSGAKEDDPPVSNKTSGLSNPVSNYYNKPISTHSMPDEGQLKEGEMIDL